MNITILEKWVSDHVLHSPSACILGCCGGCSWTGQWQVRTVTGFLAASHKPSHTSHHWYNLDKLLVFFVLLIGILPLVTWLQNVNCLSFVPIADWLCCRQPMLASTGYKVVWSVVSWMEWNMRSAEEGALPPAARWERYQDRIPWLADLSAPRWL